MAEYKEEYIPDFLEYCEIVKLKPTVRDQIIFMAGMTSQFWRYDDNVGLTQNEYEKIVKAVSQPPEKANLFEGLTQNEHEKIVKAVADKGVPYGVPNSFADLWHNIITNASLESLNHDKYYDAYHELKDAAIALVRRLELDQDVKKNNWGLNERSKIMEVIDKMDDGGCDEN